MQTKRKMRYYPLFLDVKGRNCLVVGGGSVGARKAAGLEKCGADVRVVSPVFSDKFEGLKKSGIRMTEKRYEKDDLKGVFLVFAATDDPVLNLQIKADADQSNILCNIADAPDQSNFILPSVVNRGDLVLAVSTSGKSPAMAKAVRKGLEDQFGPEYERFLIMMGNIRARLLSKGHDPQGHKQIFQTLVAENIPDLIREDDEMKINEILSAVVGKEYRYQDLISARSDI